jgi:hypothetical protein
MRMHDSKASASNLTGATFFGKTAFSTGLLGPQDVGFSILLTVSLQFFVHGL